MSEVSDRRPPLYPQDTWISDGSQVLHFRPVRWNDRFKRLEMTMGELLPDQAAPLLKRRLELSRDDALKLWAQKRHAGWHACPPQWSPAAPRRA